jgi:hypothetical protein
MGIVQGQICSRVIRVRRCLRRINNRGRNKTNKIRKWTKYKLILFMKL